MNLYRITAIALLLTTVTVGFSKPPFLKVFMSTYNIKPDSKLGKARCLICHQAPAPPIRNPYGKEVQAALRAANARMVTAEMLLSVEKLNTGDGVTNISKIKSDFLPGDQKPKPVKKAPAKKHAKKKSTKKKHSK